MAPPTLAERTEVVLGATVPRVNPPSALLRPASLALWGLLVLGCADRGITAESSETSAELESGSDLESGSGPQTGDGDGDSDQAIVRGRVLGASGDPLPSPRLEVLGTIVDGIANLSFPVVVDADGSFEATIPDEGTWALDFTHAPLEGRFFCGQSFTIEVEFGQESEVSPPPVVLPELAELSELDPTADEVELAIDASLTLRFDPGLTRAPDFNPLTHLGGLSVDPAHWRVSEVEGQPVLAAWAFSPHGSRATEGSSFTIELTDDFDAPPGTVFDLHHIDGTYGLIELVGHAQVGEGAVVQVTPVGEGLRELSWLLLTPGA